MSTRNVLLFVLFFGIWILWSSFLDKPLLLFFGVVSCLGVMWFSHRAGLLDEEGAPVHMTVGVLRFLPWLMGQTLLANLDVARRILSPNLDIDPRWQIVNGSQQSEVGFVIYANSITLTPGTVTVDLQGRGLLIHTLAEAPAKDLETGEMDRRVSLIEGST